MLFTVQRLQRLICQFTWLLWRLKMMSLEYQFLLSHVYIYSLINLFMWSLWRLKMLNLEHQFLVSCVIYSVKCAKIDQSVHVIIMKIENSELKMCAKFDVLNSVTSIFAEIMWKTNDWLNLKQIYLIKKQFSRFNYNFFLNENNFL